MGKRRHFDYIFLMQDPRLGIKPEVSASLPHEPTTSRRLSKQENSSKALSAASRAQTFSDWCSNSERNSLGGAGPHPGLCAEAEIRLSGRGGGLFKKRPPGEGALGNRLFSMVGAGYQVPRWEPRKSRPLLWPRLGFLHPL